MYSNWLQPAWSCGNVGVRSGMEKTGQQAHLVVSLTETSAVRLYASLHVPKLVCSVFSASTLLVLTLFP